MRQPNPLKTPELEFKSLLFLVLAASALFAIIVWPFFGAVCWAIFIAIVFWPLHLRLLEGSQGRRGMAALASLTMILLIVILPTGLLSAAVTQEALVMVNKVRSGEIDFARYFALAVEAMPGWIRNLLDRFGLGQLGLLQQKILAGLGQSSQQITQRALDLGQTSLDFVISFFLMLYMLYFLLRDGDRLAQAVARAIPLRQEHTVRLLTQFATVVRATVKGNIVVALVQGALGALAFWVLSVPGALLWGAVMAVLSLLPAVGAGLVWLPVAIYFFMAGDLVKAIGLTLWGVLAIGLVDNVLRPILVGRDTRMPDYLVLLATLGGIVVFGLNGFVIGPVIAAVFLVSWDMLVSAREAPAVAPAATRPQPQIAPVPAVVHAADAAASAGRPADAAAQRPAHAEADRPADAIPDPGAAAGRPAPAVPAPGKDA